MYIIVHLFYLIITSDPASKQILHFAWLPSKQSRKYFQISDLVAVGLTCNKNFMDQIKCNHSYLKDGVQLCCHDQWLTIQY